ncbi:phage tail tube protein [Avibacterium sp. 21-594]|uniref:phage tail tube protein n=1 Tax=Avibacterium sp. 21-594 TaxID=2911535 RepID=UPI0022458272|nr:phage tail tube protein [Avibacterium sp. 21-594]MCW9716758.1 phage tail tube protein [Avibacterium sp. 21-594]
MATAQGVKRKIIVAKETTFGVKPAKTAGKIIPRTESSLNSNFESFSSEEIRADMQRAPSTVGFEKAEGDIKGELAAGQWAMFLAAALRGNWTSAAKTPLIKKTSAGTGEKNGKILFVPTTGHTTDSFTIDDFFEDINLHRIYTGCRVSKISIDIQPNGIASITVTFLGQRGEETQTGYFTSPTEIAQSPKLAGVNGQLLVNKQKAALVTGLKLDIDLGASSEATLGTTYAPDVFIGAIAVSGSFTMYLQDKTMIEAVRRGQNLSLALRMDAGSEDNADYMTLILPGIKATSVEIDDGAKNLIQTLNFDAFPAVFEGGSDIEPGLSAATTLIIQDTLA